MSSVEEYTLIILHRLPGEVPPANGHSVLSSILRANKEKLIDEWRSRLSKYLSSNYYNMILFDPKGSRRTGGNTMTPS